MKLAPSLVHDVSRKSGTTETIESLVQAAHDINCRLIAVGVNNRADAQCLLELGCDYAQGNHFGQPKPIDSIGDWSMEMNPTVRED